jgi:hypothetical protein
VTQELSLKQHYDVSVDTYWDALCFDLEYQRLMYCEALGCVEMRVLANEGDRTRGLKRHLRFIKPMEMPGAIAKIFGSHITMDEFGEFDPREQRWSYRMVPSIMGDRIDIRGRVQAVAHAGGTEQRSLNTVTCRLFGLGAIIEPFVMRSAAEGHADRHRFTERYVIDKKLR